LPEPTTPDEVIDRVATPPEKRPTVDRSDDLDAESGGADVELPVVVQRPRRNRSIARPLLEWTAVGITPVVLFYVLQAEPYFRQNGLDPFMYVGYSQQPTDLIHRFGMTYYAVRFGLLWPMEVGTYLFGVTGGFFTLRWALAVLSGGALYWYFRKLGRSRALGACAALLYLTSPVLLRALMTTYSDTTAIPYLVIGGVALLASRLVRHRLVALGVAGLFLALAIHSNPFVITAGGALVAGWALSELPARRIRILADGAVIVGAILVVTAVGMIAYQIRFHDWNIIKPSLDEIRTLSGTAGQNFRSKTGLWERYQLQLYLPPITLGTLAVSVLAARRRPDRDEVAVMAASALTILYFLYQEFVQKGTALETYYYSSYLLPSTILVAGFALRALTRQARGQRALAVVAASIIAIPLLRDIAFPTFTLSWTPWVPLFAFLIAVLAALGAHRRPVALGAALVLVLGTFGLTIGSTTKLAPGSLYNPTLGFAIGNQDWSGLDILKLSYDLMAFTPDISTPAGNLYFWYSSDNGVIGSIHGPYVAFQSLLQAGGVGMPSVGPWEVQHMRDGHINRLVLIGADQTEVDGGVAALNGVGVGVKALRDTTLHYGPYSFYVELVAVTLPPLAS
jgi:hypothetical protein